MTRAPASVRAITRGDLPRSSVNGRRSQRLALSLSPSASSASVWTRARRTDRSDSSTVSLWFVSARCRRVRWGITNRSISCSLSPTWVSPLRAVSGGRFRTASANSACDRTRDSRTAGPPSLPANLLDHRSRHLSGPSVRQCGADISSKPPLCKGRQGTPCLLSAGCAGDSALRCRTSDRSATRIGR